MEAILNHASERAPAAPSPDLETSAILVPPPGGSSTLVTAPAPSLPTLSLRQRAEARVPSIAPDELNLPGWENMKLKFHAAAVRAIEQKLRGMEGTAIDPQALGVFFSSKPAEVAVLLDPTSACWKQGREVMKVIGEVATKLLADERARETKHQEVKSELEQLGATVLRLRKELECVERLTPALLKNPALALSEQLDLPQDFRAARGTFLETPPDSLPWWQRIFPGSDERARQRALRELIATWRGEKENEIQSIQKKYGLLQATLVPLDGDVTERVTKRLAPEVLRLFEERLGKHEEGSLLRRAVEAQRWSKAVQGIRGGLESVKEVFEKVSTYERGTTVEEARKEFRGEMDLVTTAIQSAALVKELESTLEGLEARRSQVSGARELQELVLAIKKSEAELLRLRSEIVIQERLAERHIESHGWCAGEVALGVVYSGGLTKFYQAVDGAHRSILKYFPHFFAPDGTDAVSPQQRRELNTILFVTLTTISDALQAAGHTACCQWIDQQIKEQQEHLKTVGALTGLLPLALMKEEGKRYIEAGGRVLWLDTRSSVTAHGEFLPGAGETSRRERVYRNLPNRPRLALPGSPGQAEGKGTDGALPISAVLLAQKDDETRPLEIAKVGSLWLPLPQDLSDEQARDLISAFNKRAIVQREGYEGPTYACDEIRGDWVEAVAVYPYSFRKLARWWVKKEATCSLRLEGGRSPTGAAESMTDSQPPKE